MPDRAIARSFGAAAALLVIACACPTARASAVDLFGYGARAQGMAGLATSTAYGHAAVYYNPGALGFDHTRRFSLGFQRADFMLEIDGAEHEAREAPALVVGFGVPLPFGGWLEDRLTVGLAFVIPQTSVLIANIPQPSTPSFTLLDNRAQSVSLQGALGIRVTDWLALGAGFLALAELDGAIDVAPNDAGLLGSTVKSNLVASYSAVIGGVIRPVEWLSVAATWRQESAAIFQYPMKADLGSGFPLPIPLLDIRGTAQYDPEQATVELSVTPVPELLLGMALTWKRWSAFENPIVFTAVPPDHFEQPAPGFVDTWTPRLGAELTLDAGKSLEWSWTFRPRLGVAREASPVPEQIGYHNYLDNTRWVTAAGLGVGWGPLTLDVALQWHHLPERTHAKDEDVVTEEDGNPGFPSIRHGGDVVFWALELGVEL